MVDVCATLGSVFATFLGHATFGGVYATSGVVLATLIAVCATFTLVCATFLRRATFNGVCATSGVVLATLVTFCATFSFVCAPFPISTLFLQIKTLSCMCAREGFGLSNFNPAVFDAGYYGLGAVVYVHFLKNAGYVIFYSFFGDE